MQTRLFSAFSIRMQFQRYMIYMICFSLCVANPGFIHLALSQQQSPPANQDQANQEEDIPENNEDNLQNPLQDKAELDKNRLLDHPLYAEVSRLGEEVERQRQAACCEDIPGVESRNLEPLNSIIQRYQQVKQSVEDYVNGKTPLQNIPTEHIKDYCLNQEDIPRECLPIIRHLTKTYANDGFLEYLTEYCLEQEGFPEECLPIIEHFIRNNTVIDNVFLEHLQEHCLNQETAPEECSSVEQFRLFFINNNKAVIEEPLNDAFKPYLEQYCFNQESMLIECLPLDVLRLDFINNSKALINRLNDIFTPYLERYCFNQEDIPMPEECLSIENIKSSLNIINNIIFMGLILSIAYKIVLTQMYLGTTLNEIDLSPFTLSVNRNTYIDGQQADDCLQNTDTFLNDEINRSLGLSFSNAKTTEHEEEEGQCFHNIEIDQSVFIESQFAIEMSKDSDDALIQFLLYPILENYYESLFTIQILKGVRSEDIDLPGIDILSQNTTFSINDLIQDTVQREAKVKLRTLNFGEALKEAFKTLIDDNPQWLQTTRLYTLDALRDISNETGILIDKSLRESIYQEEFSSRFISRIESTIDGDLGNLYCANCESHTLESYKQQRIHRSLMIIFLTSKIENIWENLIVEGEEEEGNRRYRLGIYPEIATKIQEVYTPIDNSLKNDQEPPARYLGLLESLEGLVDQWIEKALEIMEEQSLETHPTHQEYIEEIIQEVNRISLTDQSRLSAYAVYQAVKSQHDFPIHPEVSATLDRMFLVSPSYQSARDAFNSSILRLTDDISSYIEEETGETEESDDLNQVPNKIIDPNQIRDILEKASAMAFQGRMNQVADQQGMNAKKRSIEYLLVVGEDMGFFDAYLIPEGQDEEDIVPLIRDTIFSRLNRYPKREKGFWDFFKPCYYYYLSSPVLCKTDAQVYLDIYKEHQKSEILNKNRILSDRYSPIDGKPLFEIIQDHCGPEMDKDICRSRVTNIMIEALERQEQDIQDNFQELMRDLTNEDTSEALRKVMFALEEDEAGIFTNLRTHLEENHRALFDFHKERLQSHLEPTASERFVENYISKPADDLMLLSFILLAPEFVGGLARFGRTFSSSNRLLSLASQSTKTHPLARMWLPIFVGKGFENYYDYKDISSRTDFIEDLYYISPQRSALVDQAQLIMSEELEDEAHRNAVILPIVLGGLIGVMFVGGLIRWYTGSSALRWTMNRMLDARVRSLAGYYHKSGYRPGHLEKLGIRYPNSTKWSSAKWEGEINAWDMKALKEKVDILKQNAIIPEEAESIRVSWYVVSRFYNRHVKLVSRVKEARRQVGASTDLSFKNVGETTIEGQIRAGGSSSRVGDLRILQKMMQKEEALLNSLRQHEENYPFIRSLIDHLNTLP